MRLPFTVRQKINRQLLILQKACQAFQKQSINLFSKRYRKTDTKIQGEYHFILQGIYYKSGIFPAWQEFMSINQPILTNS